MSLAGENLCVGCILSLPFMSLNELQNLVYQNTLIILNICLKICYPLGLEIIVFVAWWFVDVMLTVNCDHWLGWRVVSQKLLGLSHLNFRKNSHDVFCPLLKLKQRRAWPKLYARCFPILSLNNVCDWLRWCSLIKIDVKMMITCKNKKHIQLYTIVLM